MLELIVITPVMSCRPQPAWCCPPCRVLPVSRHSPCIIPSSKKPGKRVRPFLPSRSHPTQPLPASTGAAAAHPSVGALGQKQRRRVKPHPPAVARIRPVETYPQASSERVNSPSVCWMLGVHGPMGAWGKMINSWGRPLPSANTNGAQLGSSITHLLSIIFSQPCHIL